LVSCCHRFTTVLIRPALRRIWNAAAHSADSASTRACLARAASAASYDTDAPLMLLDDATRLPVSTSSPAAGSRLLAAQKLTCSQVASLTAAAWSVCRGIPSESTE